MSVSWIQFWPGVEINPRFELHAGTQNRLGKKITLADEDMNKCMQMIKPFKPVWETPKIRVMRLTGGIVNTMILFHHDDDTDLDEALVFRINRDYSDIMGHTEDGDIPGHISRDREFMAFQIGYLIRRAPKPLVSFKNGYIYEFAKGRSVEIGDLEDPEVVRCVACSLATLHSVDVSALNIVNQMGHISSIPPTSEARFGRILKLFLTMAPQSLKDADEDQRYQSFRTHMDDISRELDEIIEMLGKFNLAKGFCHNDAQGRNMVWDKVTGHVSLVDWDISEFNYCAYDVATLFILPRYFAVCEASNYEYLANEPSHLAAWVDAYLDKMVQLCNDNDAALFRPPYDVRSKDLLSREKQRLEIELQIFFIIYHFAIVITSIYMTTLNTGVKFTMWMQGAWETYGKLKVRLPGLQEKYLSLKKDRENDA